MVTVDVKSVDESFDGFSVYAEVCGEHGCFEWRHGFPKNEGLLEEEDGVPRFVERLKQKYKRKAAATVAAEGDSKKEKDDYCGKYNV